VTAATREGVLKFGKYKRTAIADVPAHYLGEFIVWANEVSEEFQAELDRRVVELRDEEDAQ
jgi:hypothetical protein